GAVPYIACEEVCFGLDQVDDAGASPLTLIAAQCVVAANGCCLSTGRDRCCPPNDSTKTASRRVPGRENQTEALIAPPIRTMSPLRAGSRAGEDAQHLVE